MTTKLLDRLTGRTRPESWRREECAALSRYLLVFCCAQLALPGTFVLHTALAPLPLFFDLTEALLILFLMQIINMVIFGMPLLFLLLRHYRGPELYLLAALPCWTLLGAMS